jgi:hypothetical protein
LDGIHLFKHKVAEENRLNDDFISISKLGPVANDADVLELSIFYDFDAPASRNPLVSVDVARFKSPLTFL